MALAEVVDALHAREAVSQRFGALLTTLGHRIRPNTIPWSRAERAAQEAAKVIDSGGEVAPVPVRDPRVPVLGPADTEVAA